MVGSWRGVGGCAAAAQIKWQIMPKEALGVTVVARLCQWVPWRPRAEVDGGARGCCARTTKTQPKSNRNLEKWAEVRGHHHAVRYHGQWKSPTPLNKKAAGTTKLSHFITVLRRSASLVTLVTARRLKRVLLLCVCVCVCVCVCDGRRERDSRWLIKQFDKALTDEYKQLKNCIFKVEE